MALEGCFYSCPHNSIEMNASEKWTGWKYNTSAAKAAQHGAFRGRAIGCADEGGASINQATRTDGGH
jgi:hypothetical protein